MSTYTTPNSAKPFTWLKAPRWLRVFSLRVALYRQCNQLPLSRFLAAYTRNDIRALVVRPGLRPFARRRDLQSAWDAIYNEYLSLVNSTENEYYLSLQRQVLLLTDEVLNVQSIIYFLSPEALNTSAPYTARLLKALKGYGYKLNLDGLRADTPEYSERLQTVLNKLIPKKQKLIGLRRELADYEAKLKAADVGNNAEVVFVSLLRRLSKWTGYSIRPADITVSEYAVMLTDYIKEMDAKKEDYETAKRK